jgi:M-phase inducer tyrosine phosphatase
MQPPSMMSSWAHNDLYAARAPGHMYSSSLGPGAFNFREICTRGPQPDYFSMDPVRGSSPTTSLAADLSQNFHIDMRFVDHSPPLFLV